MTILVTGSAGHLGEALMRRLRAEHRPARGIDIKPSPFTDCVGSISDRDFIRRCMRGVRTVIHSATLHKPHVATHSKRDFVDANVIGTLAPAGGSGRRRGRSIRLHQHDERVRRRADACRRRACGVGDRGRRANTAEHLWRDQSCGGRTLCQLFFREHRLPVIVLRTSRFFPEADDDEAISANYETANVQANEMLYRRVDIEDVVSAHLLAVEKAGDSASRGISFLRRRRSAGMIWPVSAAMRRKLFDRLFPECAELYQRTKWRSLPAHRPGL